MDSDREELKDSRGETDKSLGIERNTADDAIARAVADADRKLDALIARDRVLSNLGLARFRRRADDRLATERSVAPAPTPEVVEERVGADDRREAERSAVDSVLESERRRADAHGESTLEQGLLAKVQDEHEEQRLRTDADLSDERAEADAIAEERDARERELEEACRAEADRGDVFAMVTHDLRNPLCVIVANASMVAESAGDERTGEAAEDIVGAAARMGRLLTDLLDVARVDAGTFALDERPHSVAELLLEMRRSYRAAFDECDVTLSVALPPEELVVTIDYDRIVQLLSNLLGNAMKFTPPGGNVGLSVEHDTEQLVFVVEDDGVGIDPSAEPHLFERFWQRDTDTRRGLGLGLFLCHTIARAHGGDIEVQSQVGVGSTFRVMLPMS